MLASKRRSKLLVGDFSQSAVLVAQLLEHRRRGEHHREVDVQVHRVRNIQSLQL